MVGKSKLEAEAVPPVTKPAVPAEQGFVLEQRREAIAKVLTGSRPSSRTQVSITRFGAFIPRAEMLKHLYESVQAHNNMRNSGGLGHRKMNGARDSVARRVLPVRMVDFNVEITDVADGLKGRDDGRDEARDESSGWGECRVEDRRHARLPHQVGVVLPPFFAMPYLTFILSCPALQLSHCCAKLLVNAVRVVRTRAWWGARVSSRMASLSCAQQHT